MRLSLTVVDTPGFGDRLDNTDCWAPALTYLHTQVTIDTHTGLTHYTASV